MKKIALVGKPNVGKSSLFNRILGHKKAIVDDAPGITRDRNYATATWVGRDFSLIDTGGILKNIDAPFQEVINQQVNYAIEEADIILFIVSQKEGINAHDQYIAKLLKTRAKNKKIILVVNKAENYNHSDDKIFFNLKFGSFFPISCTHGIGLGDLLDEVVRQLDKTPESKKQESFKFCIIGRPNVGKSSLVNTLIGQLFGSNLIAGQAVFFILFIFVLFLLVMLQDFVFKRGWFKFGNVKSKIWWRYWDYDKYQPDSDKKDWGVLGRFLPK